MNNNSFRYLLCILSLVLAFAVCANTQNAAYKIIRELPLEAQLFTTDNLQQYYAVDSTNQLRKYTPDGQFQFEYTNNTLGTVGTLNAIDPFNIALFYPDYQTITFLDRTLTETQQVSLLDAGFFDVKTIGLSRENQVWIYDANDFRLKRIDQQGIVQQNSDDLSLLLNENPEPTQIQEYGNRVYVNTPELGILVFNIFGNYLTRLDFKQVQQMQVVQEQLIFLDEQGLHAYHLKSKLTQTVLMEVEDLLGFHIQKNRLYLHKKQQIQVLVRAE